MAALTASPSILSATVTPVELATVDFTGSWREGVPGVPYYVNGGPFQALACQQGSTNGTDVSLTDATFSLTGGDFFYSIRANVTCNVPGATYQWYQDSAEDYMFTATPCGTPSEFIWTPAGNEDIELRVKAPDGTVFEYPSAVTGGYVIIQVVSNYPVQ